MYLATSPGLCCVDWQTLGSAKGLSVGTALPCSVNRDCYRTQLKNLTAPAASGMRFTNVTFNQSLD